MELLIFQLIVLLFSVVVHEVAHGEVADRLGDPTARLAGRLTLNPLKHLDPLGSVILPAALFFTSGGRMIFGWAKPMPFNPYNLKRPERDAGLIAAAGPLANLLIAVVFGILHRVVGIAGADTPLLSTLIFFETIVLINISLAVFNLVPLPPLDGSKVLFALLPKSTGLKIFLEQYGMILLVFFIFFGFRFIFPLIIFLYHLIL